MILYCATAATSHRIWGALVWRRPRQGCKIYACLACTVEADENESEERRTAAEKEAAAQDEAREVAEEAARLARDVDRAARGARVIQAPEQAPRANPGPAAPKAKRRRTGKRRDGARERRLQALCGHRVRLPQLWGGASGHVVSIDRKYENFLIKWDSDRKSAKHSVNEVVKWLVERGVSAAQNIEIAETAADEWRWAFAARAASDVPWGKVGPAQLKAKLDDFVGGCVCCARRMRDNSWAQGRAIQVRTENGWLVDYDPRADVVGVEWMSWERVFDVHALPPKTGGGEWSEGDMVSSGRSPAVSAVVVRRAGAQVTLKRAGTVENQDRELAWKWLRECSADVREWAGGPNGGTGCSGPGGNCPGSFADRVKGLASYKAARILTHGNLLGVLLKSFKTRTTPRSTRAVVSAVMAHPSLCDECDMCCTRALLSTGARGRVFVSKTADGPRKSWRVTGHIPSTHRFRLEDEGDDGVKASATAEAVLRQMGISGPPEARECRGRGLSQGPQSVCACGGDASERGAASSRFWERAGQGAQMLRDGVWAPEGEGEPGFYGDWGPEGDR